MSKTLKGITPVEEKTNDPAAAQAIYDLVINMLEPHEFSKVEVIVALMTLVATQYTDRTIDPEELDAFLKEFNQWMTAYWVVNGTKH